MAAIDPELAAALARVAPGTELRDGLERIMRGRTGALIVLGHDKGIDALISGGFPLDIDFTATRLRELCKMDGAVIIDSATARSCAPAPSWSRTRRSPRGRPGHGTAPPTGSPGRPATRSSASASRCTSSPSTSRAGATSSRSLQRSCPGPTRPWPRWSATSSASTRSPAACPPWRSRTSSRCARCARPCSAWRWCATSPTRSAPTCSSWAPRAGWSRCSWPSSWPAWRPTGSWSCATTCHARSPAARTGPSPTRWRRWT